MSTDQENQSQNTNNQVETDVNSKNESSDQDDAIDNESVSNQSLQSENENNEQNQEKMTKPINNDPTSSVSSSSSTHSPSSIPKNEVKQTHQTNSQPSELPLYEVSLSQEEPAPNIPQSSSSSSSLDHHHHQQQQWTMSQSQSYLTNENQQQQQQQQHNIINSPTTSGDDNIFHASSTSAGVTVSAGVAAGGVNAAASLSGYSFVDTLKYTKQLVQEKLGRASRTMDPMLETKIDFIKENQIRLRHMLEVAQRMTEGFRQAFNSQYILSDLFAVMGHKQPELGAEFAFNSQTQRVLYQNGEHLLAALDFFLKSLRTLCEKTTGDCLDTVRLLDQARVQYDVCRHDVERHQSISSSTTTPASTAAQKVKQYEEKLTKAKNRYEQLKADVEIKIALLNDNRIRVLRKQLLLFHNAIAAFFSGNKNALEGTMKQFSIHFQKTSLVGGSPFNDQLDDDLPASNDVVVVTTNEESNSVVAMQP